jgi:hypothetical protein
MRWSITATGGAVPERALHPAAGRPGCGGLGLLTGDSYDNALAEAVNGLYKAELIGRHGPWRTAEQVELATLEWVQWWNQRRLHGALDHIPPAEHEALYYRQLEQSKEVG